MRLTIREERPSDAAAVEDIVRRAFESVPYSDHREHRLVARLRESDAYVPSLCLLAAADGEAVGHVMLTNVVIRGEGRSTPSLALAPLSVVPTHQRRGIGSRLVETAHARAAASGFGSIVLVGSPDYYRRFGYRPLHAYPIIIPFDVPARNCMILPLAPDGLSDASGCVEYPPQFLDH